MAGVYRWIVEVSFLFVAFNDFPGHEWTIGLGVLVLGAGVNGLVLILQIAELGTLIRTDLGERKTRHTIVVAAEWTARGDKDLQSSLFWEEVEYRLKEERDESDRYADKPPGRWTGLGLAAASLVWSLAASLFGIALVGMLTSGL